MLLPNYPNPLNPETWIPYRLAQDASVILSIYDAQGQLVRLLNLRHREESCHTSRGDAAYWDGRNNVGQPVASGVYYYQMQTDQFPAVRKMVIAR